jgi:hypothetical protein
MLAEFGRDFLIRRDAVAALLHFAQFHRLHYEGYVSTRTGMN